MVKLPFVRRKERNLWIVKRYQVKCNLTFHVIMYQDQNSMTHYLLSSRMSTYRYNDERDHDRNRYLLV